MRCPPLVDIKNFKVDEHSPIPAKFQPINILRLRCFETVGEATQHYHTSHLLKIGKARTDYFSGCNLIIACGLCVRRFLTRAETEIDHNTNLFFCYSFYGQDHWDSCHSDEIFPSLRLALSDPQVGICKKFKDIVNSFLNCQCLSCLAPFPSEAAKLRHESDCFGRYVLLSSAYGQYISHSFLESDLLSEKRRQLTKIHANKQLIKLATAL